MGLYGWNERAVACSDGADNDGDGLADYFGVPDAGFAPDPGCYYPDDEDERMGTPCDNGFDDDMDGMTDWPADPSCAGPWDYAEMPSGGSSSSSGFPGSSFWFPPPSSRPQPGSSSSGGFGSSGF